MFGLALAVVGLGSLTADDSRSARSSSEGYRYGERGRQSNNVVQRSSREGRNNQVRAERSNRRDGRDYRANSSSNRGRDHVGPASGRGSAGYRSSARYSIDRGHRNDHYRRAGTRYAAPHYRSYRRPARYHRHHSVYWPDFSFILDLGRPPIVHREVIVERPVVVEREIIVDRTIGEDPREPSTDEYLSVWRDDVRYVLVSGEFFKLTSEGRVWVPTPEGAIVKTLPIGAITVWHDDNEYFEFDGAHFRRSPDGFKVVHAPWAETEEA